MTTVANIAVAVVALLHVYFLVLEMFLWDKPRGLRTFGLTPEFAAASKALAANQGLYNGFLAAGLVWGLALGAGGDSIKIFFLALLSPVYSVLSRQIGRSSGYRQFPEPLPWPWCCFHEGAVVRGVRQRIESEEYDEKCICSSCIQLHRTCARRHAGRRERS